MILICLFACLLGCLTMLSIYLLTEEISRVYKLNDKEVLQCFFLLICSVYSLFFLPLRPQICGFLDKEKKIHEIVDNDGGKW